VLNLTILVPIDMPKTKSFHYGRSIRRFIGVIWQPVTVDFAIQTLNP